jgi:hypothetical protein
MSSLPASQEIAITKMATANPHKTFILVWFIFSPFAIEISVTNDGILKMPIIL